MNGGREVWKFLLDRINRIFFLSLFAEERGKLNPLCGKNLSFFRCRRWIFRCFFRKQRKNLVNPVGPVWYGFLRSHPFHLYPRKTRKGLYQRGVRRDFKQCQRVAVFFVFCYGNHPTSPFAKGGLVEDDFFFKGILKELVDSARSSMRAVLWTLKK
jgi:hypothetical protein